MMHHARFLAATAFTTAVAIAHSAQATGINAGTLIQNTAQATYTTPTGTTTVDSNTVTLSVDELLDVTLTSLDAGLVGAAPGSATLTFELTNTGNGPEAYRLIADPAVAGNDFTVTVDSIAVDSNGNRVYDPTIDQILTSPQTTAVLAEDEVLVVFVNVTVPGGVVDGQTSGVSLRADADTGTGVPGFTFPGAGVNGVDAIVGSSGASDTATGTLQVGITTVNLTKSATVADPFGGTSLVPGSVISYTIFAAVSGSGSVDNLVVADTYPAGTTYRAGTLRLGGTLLTDQAGDDAGTAGATGISVDLGTVSGGNTQQITFDVIAQ